MLYFDQNTHVSFLGNNKLRAYHVFYRRNLIVDIQFVSTIDRLVNGAELQDFPDDVQIEYVDVTAFTLWNCMYDNPDYCLAVDEWADPTKVGLKTFVQLLSEFGFVHTARLPDYSLDKINPFERNKGNLNEQILTESLLKKEPIAEWWSSQKFESDGQHTKQTPYLYVQEEFLNGLIEDRLSGSDVLEIGSGTGYWARKMAAHANQVVGIDYQESYIKEARSLSSNVANVEFKAIDISHDSWINDFASQQFDFIFMIDFFLFLFDQRFQPKLYKDRVKIAASIASLLRTDGSIVVMDPHLFWLIPRFGSENKPYGIISEYRNRSFGVTPMLEEVSRVVDEAGMVIKRIHEPGIDDAYSKLDPQGYAFIKQFPQWIAYELKRAS